MCTVDACKVSDGWVWMDVGVCASESLPNLSLAVAVICFKIGDICIYEDVVGVAV